MSDLNSREAAVITFLATAANINLLWNWRCILGISLGLISYFVLNRLSNK